MSAVLEWVKSNVFTVVFVLLMIAALVAMPIVSGKMNASVKEEVRERGNKFGELTRLEKTQVTPPTAGGGGQPQPLLVNQKLLDRYEEVVTALKEDAEKVRTAAIQHNRKSHDVVLASMFPAPPAAQAQVLPRQFWERLIVAYENLLADVGAGQPPAYEDVARVLQRRQAQFVTQIAAKDSVEELTEEEREELMSVLTNERLMQYTLAAENIGMYADINSLAAPSWDDSWIPPVSQLYNWQWTYWIVDDVLRAVHSANADEASVLRAKVKHVLWVRPLSMPQATAAPAASSGRSGGFGGGRGGGRGGGGGGGKAGGSRGGAAGTGAPAGPDYSASFTGRKSNALYDVIVVDVGMLVQSREIPAVLDAIARYNFVTILDCRVTPVDPYGDLEQGFFYGTTPLSRVELKIETIWLREWTSPYMPDDTKRGLGIPVKDDNAAN